MSHRDSNSQHQQSTVEFVPTFLDKENKSDYSNIGNNGFLLHNVYLPEEILLHILSYVNPKELLNSSLVCRNWNKLVKSDRLWFMIYKRQYNRKPKKLPWYLYYCLLSTNYFDNNLLENENKVEHWKESTRFTEFDDSESIRELNIRARDVFLLLIKTRQVVRFRGWCGTGRRYYKLQWLIKLQKNKLLKHILDVYKPHICLTKWGSMYELQYGFLGNDVSKCTLNNCCETQSLGEMYFTEWLDLIITQYPEGIEGILLEQTYCNQDTRYAQKGSARLLFDSIEPIDVNKIKELKKFSSFEFISQKLPLEDLFEDN